MNPENSPKWNILSEILQTEIPVDISKDKNIIKPKILILCHDTKTCYQLNQYLSQGAQKYLFLMAMKKEVKFKKLSKKFLKNTNAANFIKEFNETKLEESFDKPKKSKKDKEVERPTDLNSLLEEKLFANLEDDFENVKSFFMLTMSQIGDKSKVCVDDDDDDDQEKEEEKIASQRKKKNEKNKANESCFTFEPFPEVSQVLV